MSGRGAQLGAEEALADVIEVAGGDEPPAALNPTHMSENEVVEWARAVAPAAKLKLSEPQRVELISCWKRHSGGGSGAGADLPLMWEAGWIPANTTQALLDRGLIELSAEALARYPEVAEFPPARERALRSSATVFVLSAKGENIAAGLALQQWGEEEFRRVWREISERATTVNNLRLRWREDLAAAQRKLAQIKDRARELRGVAGPISRMSLEVREAAEHKRPVEDLQVTVSLDELAALLGCGE